MTTTIEVTKTVKHKVIAYVRTHGSISNRECRDLLGIGYINAGELARVGKAAGIRYVLPDSKTP